MSSNVSNEGRKEGKGQKDVSVSGSFLLVGTCKCKRNGKRGKKRSFPIRIAADERLRSRTRQAPSSRLAFVLAATATAVILDTCHVQMPNAIAFKALFFTSRNEKVKRLRNNSVCGSGNQVSSDPGDRSKKAGVTRDIGTENRMGKRSIASIESNKRSSNNINTAAVICVRSEILHQQASKALQSAVIIRQASDNVCILGCLIQASSSPSSSPPSTFLVLPQQKTH